MTAKQNVQHKKVNALPKTCVKIEGSQSQSLQISLTNEAAGLRDHQKSNMTANDAVMHLTLYLENSYFTFSSFSAKSIYCIIHLSWAAGKNVYGREGKNKRKIWEV
jgi:hypothetical protein